MDEVQTQRIAEETPSPHLQDHQYGQTPSYQISRRPPQPPPRAEVKEDRALQILTEKNSLMHSHRFYLKICYFNFFFSFFSFKEEKDEKDDKDESSRIMKSFLSLPSDLFINLFFSSE